jgi:hypothetical protein
MAQTKYRSTTPADIDLYSIDDTQKAQLGTICYADDATLGAGEFIYLKGLDATVEGSVVTYRPKGWATALLAANAIADVAVALGACVTGKFGWYQTRGKAVMKALAGYADDALVYATATAGSVDDAVVAGDRVKNARSCSALDTPATGYAYVDINYPYMDDASAA